MSNASRTAAEAKAHRISVMVQELGQFYDALWQQVAWLHRKWDEYVALFGTKPERISLLNEAAPSFFRVVQDSLWEGVLLHIARLTDSPQSVGKPNLSFRRLPPLIGHKETKEQVEEDLINAIEATGFCRDWRNRHIAHRDLNLALGLGAEPLKSASRAQVKAALEALAKILNTIESHYLDSTTFFDFGSESGGAEALLYVIADGLGANQERLNRLKAATAVPNDWKPRQL